MSSSPSFLSGLVIAAYSLVSAVAGEEPALQKAPPRVNIVLKSIADEVKIKAKDVIADATPYLVDDAEIGLVHWRWGHFIHEIDPRVLPQLERVNAEIFSAMLVVRDMEGGELQSLMHEEVETGDEAAHLKDLQKLHESLVRMQRVMAFYETDPPPEKVAALMKDPKSLHEPVLQLVHPFNQPVGQMTLSPVARLGPGYALTTQRDVVIQAAEDPFISTQKRFAIQSGNERDVAKWVIAQREGWIMQSLRRSRKKVVHLLFGYEHNLKDNIETNNRRYPQKISLLEITVKSLPREAE